LPDLHDPRGQCRRNGGACIGRRDKSPLKYALGGQSILPGQTGSAISVGLRQPAPQPIVQELLLVGRQGSGSAPGSGDRQQQSLVNRPKLV
jgi:hypothetical protein